MAGAPRKRAQWRTVLIVDSIKDAKAALLVFDDNGEVKKPSWRSLPGGDYNRRKFQCSAHVDCEVLLRFTLNQAGRVELQRAEHREHSSVVNDKDRRNAKLTRDEKAELMLAREYGGTPATVLSKLEAVAVKNGNVQKVDGAPGEKSGLAGLLSCSISYASHSGGVPSIPAASQVVQVHNIIYPSICTHSTCIR